MIKQNKITAVVEIRDGCVEDVHNVDDYVLLDYDAIPGMTVDEWETKLKVLKDVLGGFHGELDNDARVAIEGYVEILVRRIEAFRNVDTDTR